MNLRHQIAEELIRSAMITDYNDLSTVASALERGLTKEDILYSFTVEKWPGLFAWLQERL